MSRTLNVVRMQLANRETFVWVPLLILGSSFVISLIIWGIIAGGGVTTNMYGGGAQAPLWYFIAVGVQALTLTFPFSQALSVTRREFFLGTMLTAALTAGILALIFVVGGLIEIATNGWGIGGYFFALDWLWASGPLAAGLFFFTLTMMVFTLGFWAATVYKRWGSFRLTLILVGIALVLLAAIWLITVTRSWPEVMGFIVESGVWGLTVVLAVITIAQALGSAAVLRKTTV